MRAKSAAVGVAVLLASIVPCVCAVFLTIDATWLWLFSPKYEEWRRQHDHVRAKEFLAPAFGRDDFDTSLMGFGELATLLLPGVRVTVRESQSGRVVADSRPGSSRGETSGWVESSSHLPIPLDSRHRMHLSYPARNSALVTAWWDLISLLSGERTSSEVRRARIDMAAMLALLIGSAAAISVAWLARLSFDRRVLRRDLAEKTRSVHETRRKLRIKERELDQQMRAFTARLAETNATVADLTERLQRAEEDLDAAVRDGSGNLEALSERIAELEQARDAEVRKRLEIEAAADESKGGIERQLIAQEAELAATRMELRALEEEHEKSLATIEKTDHVRRKARLTRLWDPTAHWSERAAAETSVFGKDAKYVTAVLAVCAVDAAVRRAAKSRNGEDFHVLVERNEVLSDADKRFMNKVWAMRCGLVHEARWPVHGFDFERLWTLADRIGAVPIGAERPEVEG
ncbi:MAG: hypothetical protein HC882_04655 [Acidobacteria bacterium]|nr:hypothetical protein [Acidobacteriota bacterium]